MDRKKQKENNILIKENTNINESDNNISDNSIEEEKNNIFIQKVKSGIDNNNIYTDENNNIYEVSEDIPYEKENTRKGFLLSAFSIDEARISVLILCLLLTIVFGGVNYVLVGDITANLTNIIITLIYAIAGVNITSSIVNSINNKGEKAEMIVSAKNADNSQGKKFSLKKLFSI